jgi:D-3-phosphoglycerate dehydrogenase
MNTVPPVDATTLRVVQTDEPASDRLVEDAVFSASGLAIDFTTHRCGNEESLVRICSAADGVISAYAPISSHVLEAMSRCCIVAVNATGFDGVDIARATELGIVVTNVADYCSDEVADHTLALILSLARHIPELTRSACAGEWNYEAAGRPARLGKQTLGVIGLGRIGSRVALRARSFGLRVVAYDPYVADEHMSMVGASKVSLEEALSSDFVSLHCCLTPETRQLINEQTLGTMQKHSFLVNTSRGSCVDTDALVRALQCGDIAGAALDVVKPEPLPAGHLLYSLPNVTLTPHAAFLSREALEELRRRSCMQVVAALRGEAPECIVNPEVLKQAHCRIHGRTVVAGDAR